MKIVPMCNASVSKMWQEFDLIDIVQNRAGLVEHFALVALRCNQRMGREIIGLNLGDSCKTVLPVRLALG